MKEGDTMLFSSKTIPGNEVSVARILNQLSEAGVRVIDDSDGRSHVSGHANRPDLERVHDLLKPANLIPMHGEHRHLRAHAELAAGRGIASVIAPNGAIVDLTDARASVIDNIETGRVYLDGKVLIGAMDGVVRDRIRMAIRGHVVVSGMVEPDGRIADAPWVDCSGLAEGVPGKGAIAELLEREIDDALGAAKPGRLRDEEVLEKLVVKAAHGLSMDLLGKKPVVSVLINRFEDG